MDANKIRLMNSNSFSEFVYKVLSQIAIVENNKIYFDVPFLCDYENKNMQGFYNSSSACKVVHNNQMLYDAIAYEGFQKIEGPIVFDISYYSKLTEMDFLKFVKRKIARVPQKDNITVICIINQICKYEVPEENIKNAGIKGLIIWDQTKILEWINDYQIDFGNIVSKHSKIENRPEISNIDVTIKDFENKSLININILKNIIAESENFAFVLGAGVSIDQGARSWKDLLDDFKRDLTNRGIIDDSAKLGEKIGGSTIITAQLCKELYPNDSDYFWAIHQALYANRKMFTDKNLLDHITRISKKCCNRNRFRIMTYNYDEFLERYFSAQMIQYNTVYNCNCDIDKRALIYHVHGYLPQALYKSHISLEAKKSIFLTEEDYNRLYNQPYSWQISSQLSFFRENKCLFIGCSFADPNIRRLLAIAKEENRPHYAILPHENMSAKDLFRASQHFANIGLEIIWADGFEGVKEILKLF